MEGKLSKVLFGWISEYKKIKTEHLKFDYRLIFCHINVMELQSLCLVITLEI